MAFMSDAMRVIRIPAPRNGGHRLIQRRRWLALLGPPRTRRSGFALMAGQAERSPCRRLLREWRRRRGAVECGRHRRLIFRDRFRHVIRVIVWCRRDERRWLPDAGGLSERRPFSFAPLGLGHPFYLTHGLRRGLHSSAALRLTRLSGRIGVSPALAIL